MRDLDVKLRFGIHQGRNAVANAGFEKGFSGSNLLLSAEWYGISA